MTSITGYTTNKMVPIENNTLTGAGLSGDNLIFTKAGGGTVNAGSVRGNKGPKGDSGTLTQNDLDTALAPFEFSAWIPLPLASGWAAYGGNYETPSYRYNDYLVEFRGLVKRTGGTLAPPTNSWAYSIFVDPAGIVSQARPIGAVAMQGGFSITETADVRAHPNRQMDLYVYYAQGSLMTNNWVTLERLTYGLG